MMLKPPEESCLARADIALPDGAGSDAVPRREPIWLSDDPRNTNLPLFEPMHGECEPRMLETLVRIGFNQIEVGFPSASRTDFDLAPDTGTAAGEFAQMIGADRFHGCLFASGERPSEHHDAIRRAFATRRVGDARDVPDLPIDLKTPACRSDAVIGVEDTEMRVLEHLEHAIGSGADARAAASMKLYFGDSLTLFGSGSDAKDVPASRKAITSGAQRAVSRGAPRLQSTALA